MTLGEQQDNTFFAPVVHIFNEIYTKDSRLSAKHFIRCGLCGIEKTISATLILAKSKPIHQKKSYTTGNAKLLREHAQSQTPKQALARDPQLLREEMRAR